MSGVNKVILVGNLGRDAELRYTPGGAAVSNLNVATTEVFKNRDGQKQEDTQWHRVTVWGKTAEALDDYLKKGKQIYLEGKLQTRKWQDKDGNDKYTTEVRADRIVLLSGGARDTSGPTGDRHLRDEDVETGPRDPGQRSEFDDSDIPY
jgi:single-strand DNA-binding protein